MSEVGKHASGTRNRRLVWSKLVWPLVVERGSAVFTLEQYQAKRDEICRDQGATITAISRGLASLIHKGLIMKEGKTYSLHYKLIPYMRLGVQCDYTKAIHRIKVK